MNRPPMRDGVSASFLNVPALPPSGNDQALLLDYLADRLNAVTLAQWRERMVQGLVLDEHGKALNPETTFAHLKQSRKNSHRIYYYRALDGDAEPEFPLKAAILFEDEHLLVADKPHFMPVTPSGRYVQHSLMVQLKRKTGLDALNPIHRLDRETAGLVVFNKRPEERNAYFALFRERAVEKTYEAIAPVSGQALPPMYRSRIETDPEHFFRMREVAGEPNSETVIELLETHQGLGRYRLRPRTGKTHQLRVHMNALGRPILGDLFYPEIVHGPGAAQDDWQHPLRLLARSLAFTDPITGQSRRFESPQALVWP